MLAAIWSDPEPPPDDTGQRMAGFAELLDTAIANADSRNQLNASRARLLAAGDDARRRVVRNLGIADRIETLGGRLRIESAEGDGTVLAVQLPLSTRWPRE